MRCYKYNRVFIFYILLKNIVQHYIADQDEIGAELEAACDGHNQGAFDQNKTVSDRARIRETARKHAELGWNNLIEERQGKKAAEIRSDFEWREMIEIGLEDEHDHEHAPKKKRRRRMKHKWSRKQINKKAENNQKTSPLDEVNELGSQLSQFKAKLSSLQEALAEVKSKTASTLEEIDTRKKAASSLRKGGLKGSLKADNDPLRRGRAARLASKEKRITIEIAKVSERIEEVSKNIADLTPDRTEISRRIEVFNRNL